ncbi:CCA tRNA nucleotidyltransferase [Marininema halotolerans]|uniref:tRNA nucleotidyltransferase (CCA-adding enzyme) n=1 Tax=Marininema halotolerans TaxID=1155944 RepID=A0A1I6U0K4_9BACL|nr:CCA tRNA nucleotidyltransferase [Marininema halotolerans]SFS94924.1 tRNA nucleotidyltransferase (CCA-adding enzyme) [Marininema halotolerans]
MNPALVYAHEVLERLEQAGFQAYLVGGCVRDRLMGREPADYDVATDALPEEVQQVFPKTAPTGIQHGTVGVLHPGLMTEVTTFRKESTYSDQRRPDEVTFVTSLEEDLSRRDFTVNAMAEDRKGRLYDPFGGQEDLARRRIRAVGQAVDRFKEDSLRMVRGIRFAAQLGFVLDKETEAAFELAKMDLTILAVERVAMEMRKLFRSASPSRGLTYVWQHELVHFLPPFIQWEGVSKAPDVPLSLLDSLAGVEARWAGFLMSCGVDQDRLIPCLRSFRLSKKEVTAIATVFQLALATKTWQEERRVKTAILLHGWDLVQQGIELAGGMEGRSFTEREEQKQQIQSWYDEMPVLSATDLVIDGRELLQATDKAPGSWLGEALHHLLHQTALGDLPNEKERLIEEGCRFGKKLT